MVSPWTLTTLAPKFRASWASMSMSSAGVWVISTPGSARMSQRLDAISQSAISVFSTNSKLPGPT